MLRLTVTDQLVIPIAEVASQQSDATWMHQAYQARLIESQDAIARWKAGRHQAPRHKAAHKAPRHEAPRHEAPRHEAPRHEAPQHEAPPDKAVPAAAGSPQQIAEAMLGSFGWSSSQFSCLDPLWTRESGWSVTAYNAGSGAYGIPQALPGSRMASAGPDWRTDAATQVRWGLEYIKGSYGSPCGAWAHEEATSWY